MLTTTRNRFPVCYDCQKGQLAGKIRDPELSKLCDIPEDLYRMDPFLRDIKIKAINQNSLTEKQIEAFKKTVRRLLSEKPSLSDPEMVDDPSLL